MQRTMERMQRNNGRDENTMEGMQRTMERMQRTNELML
jgi:hypothetical protein